MNLKHVQEIIQVDFEDENLLLQALTHRSYLKEENSFSEQSYERLEFLGDSILSFVIGEYFFHTFPDSKEGDLSRFRSRVVQRTTLEFVSQRLGISSYIRVGKSVLMDKKARLPLDDIYEALVGAIYLDKGMNAVKDFIYRSLINTMSELPLPVDYKSLLQEELQKDNKRNALDYKMVKEEGPDNEKIFTIELQIGSDIKIISKGYSKKEAEYKAAKIALERISNGKA